MARLVVKPGVQPKLVEMIVRLANLATEVTVVPEVVITSAMDSVHGPNSLHYALRALDIRMKNFPSDQLKLYFAQRLREEFGPDYDVIVEGLGTDQQHIHLEYDPK